MLAKSGRERRFADPLKMPLQEEALPPGNYLLKQDMQGFYLEEAADFTFPKKLYGDDHIIAERWLSSWNNINPKNMGILLAGIKGSGKTITAEYFCTISKMPVIIMTAGYGGTELISFLTNPVLGEFVLFIDEFEKLYPKTEHQETLISLMDSVYDTRIVFLMTVNEKKINKYLQNRLNRIKYFKEYGNLSDKTVKEIAEDILHNKDHIGSLLQVTKRLNLSTYDIVMNLISEMNFFKEDAIKCAFHLNLLPEEEIKYKLFLINHEGNKILGREMFKINEFLGSEFYSVTWTPEDSEALTKYVDAYKLSQGKMTSEESHLASIKTKQEALQKKIEASTIKDAAKKTAAMAEVAQLDLTASYGDVKYLQRSLDTLIERGPAKVTKLTFYGEDGPPEIKYNADGTVELSIKDGDYRISHRFVLTPVKENVGAHWLTV